MERFYSVWVEDCGGRNFPATDCVAKIRVVQ